MAEDKLSKSEANLRAILENTETGYILLDNKGLILSFNSAAISLVPKQAREAFKEGVSYLNCVEPHRRAEVRSAIECVLKTGKPVNYEIMLECSEGKGRWLSVSMHPVVNNDGKIIGLSIAKTDITESKLSDQRLRKSEANLRTIFDNTDVSYILLDRNCKVVSFNSSAVTFFNLFNSSHIRENILFSDLLSQEQRDFAEEKRNIVLAGKKLKYEREFVLADETTRWYCMNIFPVSDEGNHVLGILIAAEDITFRKNAEMEKEKITTDLIMRNTTLEQFAYIISHNLRSPVANISGLTSLILAGRLSQDDMLKCMQGLALSAGKLDEIIVDLNHILQVRSAMNEKKEKVRFSSLIRDIKTSLSSLLEKEYITIITKFSSVNEIFTIKTYLNSIFYNLISNSIKYRKPDVDPIIEVSGELVNGQVMLVFRDNGMGLDLSKNGDKIFGLYKKFHDHVEGKGMGLYMVKTQVEILGGTIKVESEPGKGTVFTIMLNHESAHSAW